MKRTKQKTAGCHQSFDRSRIRPDHIAPGQLTHMIAWNESRDQGDFVLIHHYSYISTTIGHNVVIYTLGNNYSISFYFSMKKVDIKCCFIFSHLNDNHGQRQYINICTQHNKSIPSLSILAFIKIRKRDAKLGFLTFVYHTSAVHSALAPRDHHVLYRLVVCQHIFLRKTVYWPKRFISSLDWLSSFVNQAGDTIPNQRLALFWF